MNGAPTAHPQQHPHVLFAILDWGMGHATRTWPLIATARRLGARVTVASRGTAGAWLDARMAEWDRRHDTEGLPPWTRVDKPGVTIVYARGLATLPRIALQIPRFVRSIARERSWTTEFARLHKVTHVFSDNCYGAWADVDGVRNVFMTHQLHPPVPAPVKGWARSIVKRYAERFDAVWVPDTEDQALAGDLSKPISKATCFIGPLSRFQIGDNAAGDLGHITKEEDRQPALLGLVSGPEPQRSDMEAALRTCFLRDGRPALILAGKPGGGEHQDANVLTVHDADDDRFRSAILNAEAIVCRSGYSTLLDLVVLGRTAVLVPTVGQPEQEGLARDWHRKHGWTTVQAADLATFAPINATGSPVRVDSAGPESTLRSWLNLEPEAPIGPAP